MRSMKGQTTVEMIIVVALILIVFTVSVLVAHRKTVESNDFKMMLDAKRIAQSIADNINTIAEQGPGYYRYFTLPPYISGGYDYNISIYGNFVEITWESRYGEQGYITQIVTGNATKYCLDKGGNTKNKVFNYNERILVTCNRADLMLLGDSFKPETAKNGTDVNISIDVLNYGILDVPDTTRFNVTFRNNILGNYTYTIQGLHADRRKTAYAFIDSSKTSNPGTYSIYINITEYPTQPINESYKGDNWYNATLTITT
ncbi:MAG: hypothetical protein DRO89_05740 [Candidatus Altiarchaeales archaeon]|nr:MAG: hypothetical protein DRO89_05740 [Candidatus Altiarchaeales archaeon]